MKLIYYNDDFRLMPSTFETQELIRQTDKEHSERKALDKALEEMKDLSLYVNEVKRDNEALQLINEIQNSITDLQMVSKLLEKSQSPMLVLAVIDPNKTF